VINTIIVAFAFKMAPADILSVFCISLLYCIMSPILGILINLYFPKLEWTTQVAVVKQSASVLVATLAAMITLAVPIVLFVLIRPANVNAFLASASAILVVINVLLVKALKTIGVKKFNEL
jgi:ABC-2 type transport system permease protein